MDNTVVNSTELLSLGVNLLLVIGLVFAAGWLYTRLRSPLSGGGRQINVVAHCSVGRNERMLLVEVAGQHLLVGATPAGIRTLFEFDSEMEIESVEPVSTQFAARLRAALGKAGT
ncbi:MAG: flagellar biosynthetic protein FliO [Pseudomonadota bacterium]